MIFSKENLRKIYKEKRENLFKNGEISRISDIICRKILSQNFFKEAENILIFYPKGSEMNPLGLLNSKACEGKKFYLPKCIGNEIVPCPYKTGDEVSLNRFKILEPVSKPVVASVLDIVITPALVCDKAFFRLGYGGGYYDRFFSNKNLTATKVVILPEEFIVDKLPSDNFDKKCDIIVTEKNIYHRET